MTDLRQLCKLTRRQERLCAEYLTAFTKLGDSDSVNSLGTILGELETAHMKIISWIAREKGLTHLPGIMRSQDVKFVLED